MASTLTVASFRRAYRPGLASAGDVGPLLESAQHEPGFLGDLEALYDELPTMQRDALVYAAAGLDAPVDSFLERVLTDRSQPGLLRGRAGKSLASRDAPGWEALVADELLTHGRSQGQKWDGLIALDMVGTGSQWRTVAAFLERDLKRPNRRGGDPPELVRACAYILRGIPPDEVAAFAAMLRRRRPKWVREEYHWVERCWPALLSEDAGDDWDHEALADWQAERSARYT